MSLFADDIKALKAFEIPPNQEGKVSKSFTMILWHSVFAREYKLDHSQDHHIHRLISSHSIGRNMSIQQSFQ
jgi:hypothetical protein